MNTQQNQWHRERNARTRFITLIPLAFLFVVFLPLGMVWLGTSIDDAAQLSAYDFGIANRIAAICVMLPGFLFAMWSIRTEFVIGKGTPMPMMPTQKLVIAGPYTLCRNPMAFGTILLYFGLVLWTGSVGVLAVWLVLTVALLVYIKLIEEVELGQRFGQDYAEYKMQVPFLFPWPSHKII